MIDVSCLKQLFKYFMMILTQPYIGDDAHDSSFLHFLGIVGLLFYFPFDDALDIVIQGFKSVELGGHMLGMT